MDCFKDDVLLVYIPIPAPPGFVGDLQTRFPGFEVRWFQTPIRNNWLAPPDHLTAEDWDGVTMLCLYNVPAPELIPRVRFVQSAGAGNDLWAKHPTYLNPETVFCRSTGCQPPQIAEWVIGTWLSHSHHFLTYAKQQEQELWKSRLDMNVNVSLGRRMGILGYGGIGRQCARLAQALGMEVYAYTLRERATPESRREDETYCIPGTGDPDGLIPVRWFSGASREALNDFLAQDLSILVVSLPLRDGTHHLLSAEQFEILGRNGDGQGTFVSNVARGPIIDTDALVHALENKIIPGAAVDVTDPDHLPAGHPLWKAPNIFITPHVSWQSDRFWDNLVGLLSTNLERFATGEKLHNVDDRR